MMILGRLPSSIYISYGLCQYQPDGGRWGVGGCGGKSGRGKVFPCIGHSGRDGEDQWTSEREGKKGRMEGGRE